MKNTAALRPDGRVYAVDVGEEFGDEYRCYKSDTPRWS